MTTARHVKSMGRIPPKRVTRDYLSRLIAEVGHRAAQHRAGKATTDDYMRSVRRLMDAIERYAEQAKEEG